MSNTPGTKTTASRTKKTTSKKRSSAKKRTTAKKKTTPRKKTAARNIEKPLAVETKRSSELKLDNILEQLKELGDRVTTTTDKNFHEALESAGTQFRTFRNRLNEAADKSVSAVKDVVEKIHQFSSEATDLTKIKLELHNLQREHEKLLLLIGEQVRNMYKANKLTNIRSKLKYDLKKLDELESGIDEKEKEVNRLAADLKTIK